MATIGFIGTGQMAQALAGGIAASDESVSFVVSDPSAAAVEAFCKSVGSANVELTVGNENVFALAEIVFIAVKPQYFEAAVVPETIAAAISNRQQAPLVVSIMAGIGIEKIQNRSGIDQVIRVMPNTPCLVGAGAAGISHSPTVSNQQVQQVSDYLATTGLVIPVPEDLLDAVTGVSGSGPAYVFEFIDALALGGVRCGLSRTVSQQLAAQTVLGAAKLLLESDEHPTVLRDCVSSPGGTTIAGLEALYDNGFKRASIAAVQAATQRSRELS